MFAVLKSDDQEGYFWQPLYLGRTWNLAKRLPTHERWQEAVELGMTHVHVVAVKSVVKRILIEKNLIQKYRPILNVQGTVRRTQS